MNYTYKAHYEENLFVFCIRILFPSFNRCYNYRFYEYVDIKNYNNYYILYVVAYQTY